MSSALSSIPSSLSKHRGFWFPFWPFSFVHLRLGCFDFWDSCWLLFFLSNYRPGWRINCASLSSTSVHPSTFYGVLQLFEGFLSVVITEAGKGSSLSPGFSAHSSSVFRLSEHRISYSPQCHSSPVYLGLRAIVRLALHSQSLWIRTVFPWRFTIRNWLLIAFTMLVLLGLTIPLRW